MSAKQAGRYPAAEYARKLLAKYPDAATMTLARRAHAEQPKLFRTLNQARQVLRMQRGELKCGRSKGKMVTMPVAARSTTEKEKARTGGVMIPPGKKQCPDDPYELRLKGKDYSALLLCDVHVPYHDQKALTIAIEEGKRAGVKAVIINGDFIDMYAISRFVTDPRERDFPGEIETTKAILAEIRRVFPDAEIVFKVGNHEQRYSTLLFTEAPALLGIEDFELPSLLRLKEKNIQFVESENYCHLGMLPVIHGHEMSKGFSAPVNAARGLYLKAKESCLMGHLHHSSSHNEKSLSGRLTTTWSVGCLCDDRPKFCRVNKWNHGFAVVEVARTGKFRVFNQKIMNDQSVVPA